VALALVIDGPPKRRPARGLEQRGHAAVRSGALAEPGDDPGIDAGVEHVVDLAAQDRGVVLAVEARKRMEVRERIGAALPPGLGEPRVVEGGTDRVWRLGWVHAEREGDAPGAEDAACGRRAAGGHGHTHCRRATPARPCDEG